MTSLIYECSILTCVGILKILIINKDKIVEIIVKESKIVESLVFQD